MSEHSDSGSSRLSDWALVNSQGELEGSDEDSNSGPVDIVEQQIEKEKPEHGDLVSREITPECIELGQLMRKADAAERQVSEEPDAARAFLPQPAAGDNESLGTSSLDNGQLQEVAGACCGDLLQSAERRQPTGEGEEKLMALRQLSQDSDSPASSTSVLSLSDISSISTTSKSSRSDSDSESDFVRLEKESSCVSTESEGEELTPRPRVSVMSTSGSSVGSGFNFLPLSRGASLEPPSLPVGPAQALPPAPPQLQHQEHQQQQQQEAPPTPPPQQAQHVSQEEQPLPPPENQQPLQQQQQQQAERPLPVVQQQEPQPQQARMPEAAATAAGGDNEDADDGDTESSNEDQDQDDRIESEQSDDAHSAQVDDGDDDGDLSALNDFGDLPLALGERHYIHRNNQHLNVYLNRVVLAVIVLALGMGIGHWIGSTQEHFSQLEIQLSQMKRLHLLQDKYVQCLAHNDELHLEFDVLLQKVTDQMKQYSQEESDAMALADLRNNNLELQKQLQDAQNQLEEVLVSIGRDLTSPKGSGSNQMSPYLKAAIDMANLIIASEIGYKPETVSRDEQIHQILVQARQAIAANEEGKGEMSADQQESRMQEELVNIEQLKLAVQDARQQINSLQNENAELKVTVGRMRYNADGVAGKASSSSSLHEHRQKNPEESEDYSLPPPPNPLPPPPLVQDILDAEPEKKKLRCVEPSDCMEDYGYDPLTGKMQEQETDDGAGYGSNDDEDYGVEVEDVEDDVEEMQDPHIIVSANPQKPTVNAGSPQPVPVDVTLLQRNLSQEQQRADMWRRLYLSARAENRKELPLNGSACVQYLMHQMNVSALLHSVFHWNLTGAGGTQQFTDLTHLVASIVQLQRSLVDSLPSVWEEISSTLHGFHSDQGTNSAGGGKGKSSSRKGEAEKKEKAEEPKAENDREGADQSKWSDSVKKLLNKTRGTLTNVSHQIQQTWGQVKNASRQLWPSDDSVLSRMAARVKNGMSKLSRKMQKKALRWFKKKDKGTPKRKFEDDAAWEKSADEGERMKASKNPGVMPANKKEMKKKGKKFTDTESREQKSGKKSRGKEDENRHGTSHGKHGEKEKKSAEEKVRSSKHSPEHPESRNVQAGSTFDKHFKKSHGKGSKKEKKNDHLHKKHWKKNINKVMEKEFKKRAASDRYPDKESHGKDGERMARFNKHKKEKITYGKNSPKNPEGQRKERKENEKENVGPQPQQDLRPKETEFHTKAKDHSSHSNKVVFKIKLKLEEQYQDLFSQVGYLGLPGFNRMDKGDIANIRSELNELFQVYNNHQELGFSASARDWLKCQSKWFWRAEQGRLVYQPVECVQYLTPWQLTFAEETKVKLATGECQKKLVDFCYEHDCVDPPPEFTEDHYRFVCKGDDDYSNHPGMMGDAGKGKRSSEDKNKPRPAPKGRKEDDMAPVSRGPPRTDSNSADFRSTLQRINQTEDDHKAWYFDWLEGRDNLREGELKADWVFDRALDRQQSRQQEQTDNWVFERASNRDTKRESTNQGEEDAEYSRWRAYRKDQHKGKEKAGHFKHREGKHQHEWREDNYKHHGKDFRQKYGRATFCDSC